MVVKHWGRPSNPVRTEDRPLPLGEGGQRFGQPVPGITTRNSLRWILDRRIREQFLEWSRGDSNP